ncbi:MAG: DoxX family protein [Verrucomicrobiales bacterium]|jgi:putative oxidoreductase|nr:DoxX family protein [Verrucomicrobiales bacterium]
MHNETIHSLGKLLLRLSVGGLMLCHGIHKLTHGMAPIKQMLAAHHLPVALVYGVPVGEIIAPLLLILGIWSRLAGLVLSFNMGMAVFLAYGAAALNIDAHGGANAELALLYLFGGLAITCLGSGKFAVSGGAGTWN